MHVALPQCMLGMFLLVHDKAAGRSRHPHRRRERLVDEMLELEEDEVNVDEWT